MRRAKTITGLAAMLLATIAQGQPATAASVAEPTPANASPGGSGTQDSTQLDTDFYTKKIGPLTVAAGPATGGGFGVSVSGDQGTPLTSLYSNVPAHETQMDAWYHAYMGSLSYKVDSLFTTQASSPNNASISLDPGFDLGMYHGRVKKPPEDCKPVENPDGTITYCRTILPNSEFGFGAKGDIEYRYGTVKQQDGKLVNANQGLVGASIYMVPSVLRSQRWFLVVPLITATYYKPVTTDTSAISLPTNVKANYLQTEFHTKVGWDISGKYPLALDVKYDGSRPFTGTDRAWQSLWKLQLSIGLSGSSVKPAVTYQSGAQGGLQYDREVIFGFLAELLKPGK